MELKETHNIPTLSEKKVQSLSEKNDPNKQRVYNILFPLKDEASDRKIEIEEANQYHEKRIFGDVSTLDWLKTWRSLEENYLSSSEPGK